MPVKVLIANRGEVAIRIARTLVESGYIPVGIYTADDADSLHRRFLVDDTEVSSYLDIKDVVNAAVELGAEAVHPGYGFLGENPEFAHEVARKGLVFIGPPPGTITLSRDKLASKTFAEKLEVPTLPWVEVHEQEDVIEFAKVHGYPVIVKATSSGGEGIGVAWSEKEVESAIKSARSGAEKSFKDVKLYVEPYIEHAKHIEVQVLGDGDNIVHLYERECSIRRNFYQKIIEEAPSPFLNAAERGRLYEYALKLASGLRYVNAGVVKFVFDIKKREMYFTEIGTGLQAGHSATEMITRIDLVKKQVEVALYKVLGLKQHDVMREGHAIEACVYAENPYTGEPSQGIVKKYKEPGGPGVRVDSGIAEGSRISGHNDPLIAKVIAWGSDRYTSVQRLERALREYVIDGVPTNIPLLRYSVQSPEFISANYTIRYFEIGLSNVYSKMLEDSRVHAVILSTLFEYGDASVKAYSKKASLIEHVLKSEKVSSIKRRAWYYYVSLKTALERSYSGRKSRVREERSKR
ncbi:MAG: biotin carboxylase N-terminal domain-containing protein [Desulfurococcaceae archaeon]